MTATTRPRYADTARCPDCRSLLPAEPFRCPTCALPLRGFLATELLRTLSEADELLVRLRAAAVPYGPPPAAPVTAPMTASVAPRPLPAAAPRPARTGLQGASVPKVLLGLGATCLLVAAVIFLAVAWTWLGVGGRTAVLVTMTAASGGLGLVLGRRGLRVAAEALTTVALGLVVLDLVGAEHAGWLGDITLDGLTRLVGLALLVPALALSVPRGRLVVPQLAAAGAVTIVLSTVDWTSFDVGAVDLAAPSWVLALAALVAAARRVGAEVLAWATGAIAALVWAGAGAWALSETVVHPTVRGLWVDGHAYEVVALGLIALLLGALDREEPLLRQGPACLLVCSLTYLAVLPGLDGTQDQVTLIALAVTLGWAIVSAVTPPAWYAVPRVPLAVGALSASVTGLVLAGLGAAGLFSAGAPFTRPAGVRLEPLPLPAHPLLLLATAAVLALSGALAAPRTRWTLLTAGAGVGGAGVLTLGLYPVPLWLVVVLLALLGAASSAAALRRDQATSGPLGAAATVAFGAAILVGLPSAVITTATLTVVVVALGALLVRGRWTDVTGLLLPVALGGLLWSVAEVAHVDVPLRAAPVILLLGVLAIALPRVEVEVGAALTGFLTAAAAGTYAGDQSVWLAVHLTLAGALVTASSILNPTRRDLAWPGGALLVAATWVRLWDVGVVDPEPYTLPTAAALVLAGLHRMRRSEDAATAVSLGPGLTLATVPSLLWVLTDPVSLRAGVLGLACLLALLAGVQLRWHAPVVVGSVVGGLVVVRELAPYAMETPQWVLIGLAGTVLIACGVTWESRMRDLQHATAYLARLR
jgi:hypothetical protein